MKHTIATIALAAFAAIAATVALAETRYNLPTHEQVQAVLNATVANASNDLAICYDRVAQLGGAVPPDESARTLAALPDVIYSVTNTDRFAEWLNVPSVMTDISSAVTNLRQYAFYGCTALKSVDLPNATSIGQYAFYGCTALQSLDFPNVTSIGAYALAECTSVTSLVCKKIQSIGDHAFANVRAERAVFESLITVSGGGVNLIGPFHSSRIKTLEFPDATRIVDIPFNGYRGNVIIAPKCVRIPEKGDADNQRMFRDAATVTDVVLLSLTGDYLINTSKVLYYVNQETVFWCRDGTVIKIDDAWTFVAYGETNPNVFESYTK